MYYICVVAMILCNIGGFVLLLYYIHTVAIEMYITLTLQQSGCIVHVHNQTAHSSSTKDLPEHVLFWQISFSLYL